MSLMKKKKAHLLCLSFFMIALLGILSMKVVNASGETKLETDGTCITGTVDDGAAYYYFETTEYTYKIKAYYKNYTYNANKGKYTSKNVTSIYSKIASVKR